MIICKTCKQCGGWTQMSPNESKEFEITDIDPVPKRSEEIGGHLCDCSKEEKEKNDPL